MIAPPASFNDLGQANLKLYTGPGLPQEVYELIIDYVVFDSGSLRNCALVSQAWCHRARYHLFGVLHPRRRRAMEALYDHESNVSLYVRSLHLDMSLLTKIGRIPQLRELKALRELTLEYLAWPKYSKQTKTRLISLIKQVKKIKLIAPVHAVKCLEWVNHAPNLEELSIDPYYSPGPEPLRIKCNFSVLKILTINADHVAPMLEWLGTCGVVTLKILQVGQGGDDGVHLSLLGGFDPGLEHLEMVANDNPQQDHHRDITQSTYRLHMHASGFNRNIV